MPYNSIQFNFTLERSTISGLKLSASVYLPEATSVLPGSIFANLPNFES